MLRTASEQATKRAHLQTATSTTGDRKVGAVDLQSIFAASRSGAVTAVKAHPEWNEAEDSDFDVVGATLLKPFGVHVGVTHTQAQVDDDREVGNDGGWGGSEGSGSGAPTASSHGKSDDDGTLLEDVLGGSDIGSLDTPSNMIALDDGSLVQKAAAYRIAFGHGTDKSNDRATAASLNRFYWEPTGGRCVFE